MSKERYESPLASRYASAFMLHLFSPDMRFETWRRLWVALARAEHNLGLHVTAEQVAELEAQAEAARAERDRLTSPTSTMRRLRRGRRRSATT